MGENKTRLLQLIQQAIDEDKQQLGNRIVYCQKICSSETTIAPALRSDHEQADTKLVALVVSYLESVADDDLEQSVMVCSPSDDINILVLFVLHCFGSNVFIDNSHGNSGKMFDFKTPPYFSAKLYQVFMHFQEMITYQVSLAKENTYFGKLLQKMKTS